MTLTRRAFALSGISLAALIVATDGSLAQSDSAILGLAEGTEEFSAASDAYIYGYPLVTMEMTRRIVTNVAEPEGHARARWARIIKLRQYPDATFRDVTAPNADTLYTTAFFDVGDEPWVLDQPDMGDRYFLLPLLSRLDGRVRGAGQRAPPAARPRPSSSPAPAGPARCRTA